MFGVKTVASVVGMVLACMLAAGCCQDQEKQIASLKGELQKAMNENADLRHRVTDAEAREHELQQANQALMSQMGAKDTEIAGLQKRLSEKPTVRESNAAPGWETGIFGDRIRIGTDLLFSPGKEVLTKEGKAKLDQIAQDIKTHYTNKPIHVYGNTDTDPIKKSGWDDNWELSCERALSVTRYLIGKGVMPTQIEATGRGQYHPESPGDKAKNRRVEIYVVKVKE
jgi:chemotaxis protein MotB